MTQHMETHRRHRRRKPNTLNLPTELWEDILSRLPAKTILTLRCVCKSLCYIIDSKKFTSYHMQTYNNNMKHTHFLAIDLDPKWNGKGCFLRQCDTFETTHRFNFTIGKENFQHFEVEGHVNGVLLLYLGFPSERRTKLGKKLILWNPTVRKVVDIPFPPPNAERFVLRNKKLMDVQFGFGYDSLKNDYKVVMFIYPKGYPKRPCHIEIYRLGKNAWRVVKSKEFGFWCSTHKVFLNGDIHMLGCDMGPSKFSTHLVSFAVGTEEFSNIQLPELVSDDGVYCNGRYITYVGGSVGVLDVFGNGSHQIWVLENCGEMKTWMRKYTFNLDLGDSIYIEWKKSFLYGSGENIDSYNVETEEINQLVEGVRFKHIDWLDTYVDSLALFRHRRAVSDDNVSW